MKYLAALFFVVLSSFAHADEIQRVRCDGSFGKQMDVMIIQAGEGFLSWSNSEWPTSESFYRNTTVTEANGIVLFEFADGKAKVDAALFHQQSLSGRALVEFTSGSRDFYSCTRI